LRDVLANLGLPPRDLRSPETGVDELENLAPSFAAMEVKPISNSPSRTRVMCIDDSADMTEMLVTLIRNETSLENVGTLDSADGVVDEVRRSGAQVLVIDLTMPGVPPLEAIRDVRREVPSCQVIAFSGYDDLATQQAAMSAGAVELVSKSGEPGDVIAAIHRVVGRKPTL